MTGQSVLFLGGTGIISSACTQRAVEVGMEVFLLNRGRSTSRPVPDGCQILVGDLSDLDPVWQYSRDKIACEDLLIRAYRETGLPATIVRPSHTYDKTLLPFDGGWTVVDRMRRGVPVVVHGDGTSLWTCLLYT